MYKIVIHKRAASYLRRLPAPDKDRVKNALKAISDNPEGHHQVRQMLGEWKGYYRLRVGNYRVVFWIDNEAKTLYVDHIGPRGDAYKN